MKTQTVRADGVDKLKTYTMESGGQIVGQVRFNFTADRWESRHFLNSAPEAVLIDREDATDRVKEWLAAAWRSGGDVRLTITVCSYCGGWSGYKQAPGTSHGICTKCVAEALADLKDYKPFSRI